MKSLLYICVALMLTQCVSQRSFYEGQDWVWVETVHRRTLPGEERQLVLSGSFVGADTVYIQMYHDGELITDNFKVGTFTITLSEFDTYEIKFTDTQKRVKRISVHELGDNMIEFYPPREIDFERVGNIVLIKPDAKRYDFAELDAGDNRSQPKKRREQ